MEPIGLAHKFLIDLVRLPLMFKLFLLYGAGATAWQWWKARQKAEVLSASEAWPVYRARVVWAQVSEQKGGGRSGSPYWEGLLTYSYTIPGHDLEVGEYRKRFEDETEADDWTRALRDTFIDVRVDPADVKRSVWQETAILTTPPLPAPNLDANRFQGIEAWGIRETLAAIVVSASALGAFLAAWIQISCLAGKPAISTKDNEVMFVGMHIGAILSSIAAGLLTQRGKWTKSMWQRYYTAGTTGTGMKILGAYTTVVFLYGWVRMASQDGDSEYFGVLMFSAIWLMFYIASAANCLHALQHQRRNAD